jgi:hypothetical protein
MSDLIPVEEVVVAGWDLAMGSGDRSGHSSGGSSSPPHRDLFHTTAELGCISSAAGDVVSGGRAGPTMQELIRGVTIFSVSEVNGDEHAMNTTEIHDDEVEITCMTLTKSLD